MSTVLAVWTVRCSFLRSDLVVEPIQTATEMQRTDSMAAFTLQVLMTNSDFVTISDFLDDVLTFLLKVTRIPKSILVAS